MNLWNCYHEGAVHHQERNFNFFIKTAAFFSYFEISKRHNTQQNKINSERDFLNIKYWYA